MNSKQEKSISKIYMKLCDKYKVNHDKYDIKANWDSSLSLKENWSKIERDLKLLSPLNTIDTEEEKKKYDLRIQEEIRNQEELIKEKQQEAIKETRESKTPALDRFFFIPKQLINILLKSKDIHSLILRSSAGLGKTYTVLETLSKNNLEYEKDFILIAGHITPLEFYTLSYNNRNKIIVVDDVSSVFSSIATQSLILAMLWNPTGIREVRYLSTTDKLEAPNRFEFTGKLIFCINEFPEQLEALKSRCYYYEFIFTYSQKIQIMYEIAKLNNILLEVVDFIKDNTNEAYTDLDFRLLFKINDLKKHSKEWKRIGVELLEADAELQLIRRLMETGRTVEEQVKEFLEATGHTSRATYFNLKRKLK